MIFAETLLLVRATAAWVLATAAAEKAITVAARHADDRPPPGGPTTQYFRGLLIAIELAIALALCFPGLGVYAASVAAVLFLCFSIYVFAQWRSGNSAACHCGGLLPTQRVGPLHAASNLGLGVACALIPAASWASATQPARLEPGSVVVIIFPLLVLLVVRVGATLLTTRRQLRNLDALAWGT